MSQSYADTDLDISWGSFDADLDPVQAVTILWYRDDIYQPAYDNFTIIPALNLTKGQAWYCKVSIFDGEDWSLNVTSQGIDIINKPPTIASYGFIVNETRKGNFSIEDEGLSLSYTFTDIDFDTDNSTIQWYRNGEHVPAYDNWTIIPASETQIGDLWFFRILPHDGTDQGTPVTSQINMTIENRPRIEDYGVIPIIDTEGHYVFWIRANDSRNTITDVKLTFLNLTRSANDNGTHWILEYSFDPAIIDSNVSVTINVASVVVSSNDIIRAIEAFDLPIEDRAPPRVLNVIYFWDEDDLTNITFVAEIEEFGSGIAEVIIFYYFRSVEEVPSNTTTAPTNASWLLGGIYLRSVVQNEDAYQEAPMLFNGTHWIANVPFNPTTSVDILYRISVTDNAGNMDPNADPRGENPSGRLGFTFKEPGGVDPEFVQQMLLIIAVAFLAVLAFSAVAIKKWRSTELVGLDKDRVIQDMSKIGEDEIDRALDLHTLGIVVSFFDQRHGPLPIIIVPEILRDNFDKLVELSDHSFSTCQFLDDFEEEKYATFDFVLARGLRVNSISFAFALDRPQARGGAENITVNILVQPEVFPLVNQFVDYFAQNIHEMHVTMDKEPSKQNKLLAQVAEVRKQISYIILSYEQLYGTTELVEE
ncbi:MAG: hypothetical protein ACE5OZ_22930 [Candidatus Heimdallarchaeota archaeon]